MKKFCLSAIVLACVACSSVAGTISWNYGGDLGGSYTAGWLVELIEDVDKDGIDITTMWDDHSITGDDAFITTPITTVIVNNKAGTYWGTTFSAPGSSLATSDRIYSVIYNASTFGAATQYQVVDSSPFTLPATDIDTDYIQSTVNGSWAPIVAVPEPGSIALFAIGLVTLAVRRKRR